MIASFTPDLIVEATAVCDRQCAGCYAPNLVSKLSPAALYELNPDLFLNPQVIETTLQYLTRDTPILKSIAIRGGEPTRHPLLAQILRLASTYSQQVYLETHGGWIDEKTEPAPDSNSILSECKRLGTVIKLSFDRMHGLNPERLKKVTHYLTTHSIEWIVAVTEKDLSAFESTTKLYPWISQERILFQRKAAKLSELIRPKLGVINVRGAWSRTLNTLPRFEVRASAPVSSFAAAELHS